MRFLPFSNAIVFSSCLVLLTACGGDSSSSSSSGSSAGTVGSTTTSATVTSTAVLHVGSGAGEATNHVLNTTLSVLDADGAPVDNLDGGDFRVIAATTDYEGFHHVQKMDFSTQVNGHLVLMLDISNDMAPRFAELQTAAVRLVNQAIAIGLSIDVYKFWSTGTVALVGSANDLVTAATVNTAINALTPQLENTFFYESIATVVAARLGVGYNNAVYSHNAPATPPTTQVEVMIIMSDGLESPGTTNSSGDVTALSDGVYWITSIAVGDNPDVAALGSITTNTFPVTEVPAGGTYSDAVDTAMTFIDNYYHGFYLVEYQLTDLLSAAESFDIKLIDNDSAKVTVGPFDATTLSTAWLTPVCCEVWAAPGEGVDATATVAINATAGNTMEFQVVQLWSNLINTGSNVSWTLSGNMTGQQNTTDPSVYTVTTTGTTGSGSLTVNVVGGTPSPWSTTIPITLN